MRCAQLGGEGSTLARAADVGCVASLQISLISILDMLRTENGPFSGCRRLDGAPGETCHPASDL
jgi:hypothetical protein